MIKGKISETDPIWWTMYAVFAPIIVWPGYEKDYSDQKMNVMKARFNKIANNDKSKRATDAEITVYLSSASGTAPMEADMANVYTYAAAKAFPEIKNVVDKVPNLTAEQQKIYDKLAAWIFKKQEEELNKKLGNERLKA
ncbi:MAG: hypothetical protein QXL94_00985 [Candidatus Parvarchaeum sp.]